MSLTSSSEITEYYLTFNLLSTYFTNKLIITNVIKHNFLFFFDNADANAGLCYINSFNYLYNFTNINTLEEIGNYHILSVLLVFIHLFIAYKIFNNWLYIYILATSLVWSYTALSWSFLWVWESIEIFLILVITTHSYMVHIYNFKSKNLMYLPIFSILIKINYFNDILFIHGFGLIYPYSEMVWVSNKTCGGQLGTKVHFAIRSSPSQVQISALPKATLNDFFSLALW